MFRYDIYQYRVHSELPLPCDGGPAGEDERPPDVVIRRANEPLAEFPQVLYTGRFEDGLYRAYDTGDGTLFCAADYLKLHVDRAGERVLLEVEDRYLDTASLYAVGVGLGICIHFRGSVALHAAAVDVCGRRIAIMAPTGAGKSTLLCALLERGGVFANDDLIPVDVGNGTAEAAPSRSLPMRLSPEAIDRLAVAPDRVLAGFRDDKYFVSVPVGRRSFEVRPLAAIFWLEPSSEPSSESARSDEVAVNREVGAKAVVRILDNLYAFGAISSQVDPRRMMLRIMSLLGGVPLYTLRYRKRFETVPALAETIMSIAGGLQDGTRSG